MRVSLQYRQIEEALVRLNDVAERGRPAFRARLRHLKQMEFPPGTNTGKGQRANYSFANYLQLVLAMELEQAGFAPQRVVRLVLDNWPELEMVFLKALTPDEALEKWHGSPNGDLAIILHPQALTAASRVDAHIPFERVHWLTVDELPEVLRLQSSQDVGDPWRSLVILARPLAEAALNCVRMVAPTTPVFSFWEDLRDDRVKRMESATAAIKKILNPDD